MGDVISILRSDLQQLSRDKYQQRLMNDPLTVPSISNSVAHKTWWGHISPSAPGRLLLASHGKRYLSWDITFTCTDGTDTWSLHSYGTFGRLSGAVVAAQCDITDTNNNYNGGQFHGPSGPIACGHITVLTSPTEASMHMEFDTSGSPFGTNPVMTGSMDIVLTDVNDYTQVQVDCRDLYLSHDISGVPDNAWQLLEMQEATNSQGQWLTHAYHEFAHGPCAGQPGNYSGIDTRFNWPVANCDINGNGVGVVPSNGTGTYPGIGSSAITWPLMADYRLDVVTLDTSGFVQGNALTQQASGSDFGEWTMIGALYRHMKTGNHCLKTRVTGTHYDAGSNSILSTALDNVDLCRNANATGGHNKTFYIDAPIITINADNVDVNVYDDPNFTLRASTETDGSCDCVGKPGAPFFVSATPGGAVMVIAWSVSPADHVINVDIYRSEISGAEVLLQSAWGSGSPYLDALVASGHTYYYKLKARNAWGTSDFSAEVFATL